MLSIFIKIFMFAVSFAAFGANKITFSDFNDVGAAVHLTQIYTTVDGTRPATRGKRFVKLKSTRSGESFEMWCSSPRGSLKETKASTSIGCSKGITTVSDDDNESLSSILTQELSLDENSNFVGKKVSAQLEYDGNYEFLSKEAQILLGTNLDAPIYRKEYNDGKFESTLVDSARTPFDLAATISTSLRALIGKNLSVTQEGLEIRGKISKVNWDLNLKQELLITAYLGETQNFSISASKSISTLRIERELDSGYDSVAIIERALKAFGF